MTKKNIRIVLEVSEKLRLDLKQRASDQYMTLKNWILRAIAREIKRENELQP